MQCSDITGCILAGGQGSRMGGVDKGLQPFLGQPLAAHALRRLAPQVGALVINANRHADEYIRLAQPYAATHGALVAPDAEAGYPGPLAGFLCGLRHCATPWLLTVATGALVALATMGGTPAHTSAGKVRKVPPPAMALSSPAPSAASASSAWASSGSSAGVMERVAGNCQK